MFKRVNGDLLEMANDGTFDYIIHGCNCFCTMGSGIAKQIANRWPEAYDVDKQTKRGDRSKLGGFSLTPAKDQHGDTFFIINAYTQYHYGKETHPNVDYNAIQEVFTSIGKLLKKPSKIGYPQIGAGLAGGKWEEIEPMIREALKDHDHTVVIFDG